MSDARVKRINSWRGYIHEVNDIYDELAKARARSIHYYSDPLFRGQPNARWKLDTTLERVTDASLTMKGYQRSYAVPAHSLLSCFNDRSWPFIKEPDCSYENISRRVIPNYEFLGYLRHHGFPSPLLDWTASPYVAAFFAFDTAANDDEVAIFWFQEYAGTFKSTSSDKARISTMGPYAAVHKRHFLQQSQYSISYTEKEGEALFVSHEVAINDADSMFAQDKVMKFILPADIKNEVLFELNRMNINPYSIYQSEDSLVRTVGNNLFTGDGIKRTLFLKAMEEIL